MRGTDSLPFDNIPPLVAEAGHVLSYSMRGTDSLPFDNIPPLVAEAQQRYQACSGGLGREVRQRPWHLRQVRRPGAGEAAEGGSATLYQELNMRSMLQCSFRPMTSSTSRSSTPRRYSSDHRIEQAACNVQARPAAAWVAATENGYAAAAARRASLVQVPVPRGLPVALAERAALPPRRGSAGAAGFQPPGRGALARRIAARRRPRPQAQPPHARAPP
ncbi:unnamed protein product [Prorocentrum cordatum]|uniref:Uncharacterized protein n=1 Tax=Prorocentrum cordatum TaxID=2364126 RepID=A0ABN9TDJ2_9DINO|nr:unnamed protein product [Polarella glacialis]